MGRRRTSTVDNDENLPIKLLSVMFSKRRRQTVRTPICVRAQGEGGKGRRRRAERAEEGARGVREGVMALGERELLPVCLPASAPVVREALRAMAFRESRDKKEPSQRGERRVQRRRAAGCIAGGLVGAWLLGERERAAPRSPARKAPPRSGRCAGRKV
jgi:hypothetical protein